MSSKVIETTNMNKRLALFLLGCIPTRILFAYVAKIAPTNVLNVMGVLGLFIAIGFTVIYFGGYRKVGVETGGARIWWNDLRPIHALFYYTFAYMVFFGNKKNAWMALGADVIFGLISFLTFHIKSGDIKF